MLINRKYNKYMRDKSDSADKEFNAKRALK